MYGGFLATQLSSLSISNLNSSSSYIFFVYHRWGHLYFSFNIRKYWYLLYCINLLSCQDMSKNRIYTPNLVRSAKSVYTFHPQIYPPGSTQHFLNLQLQWTPIGSNGKRHQDPLIIVSFLNLKLRWDPMVITIWKSSKWSLFPLSSSNGLQW